MSSVELSRYEVLTLFRLEQWGRPPQPFEFKEVATEVEQRRQLEDAAIELLTRRGVMRNRRLVGWVRELLMTYGEADVAVMVSGAVGMRDGSGETLLARVCLHDGTAVKVVQDGDNLVFEEIRPTAFAAETVSLLPEIGQADGRPLRVPAPRPKRRDESEFQVRVLDRGPSATSPDKRMLQRVFAQPMLSIGGIQPDIGHGRNRVRMDPVGWVDTEQERTERPGRYVFTTDGEWTTYTPADRARATQILHDRLEAYLP